MNSSKGEEVPSGGGRESFLKAFLAKLRKRKIIETLAAFIGGGFLAGRSQEYSSRNSS